MPKLWELLEERDRTGNAFNRAKNALIEALGDERVGLYAWLRGDREREEILFVGGFEACLAWGNERGDIHQYDGTVLLPRGSNADFDTYAPRELIQARIYPAMVNGSLYAAAIAWLKENEKDEQ